MIIFYHFPKCAGTSIKHSLHAYYNRLLIEHYPFETDPSIQVRMYIDRPMSPVTLIYIHEWSMQNTYITGIKIDAMNDTAFTFIRHPVRLLQSLYHSIRESINQNNSFMSSLCSQDQYFMFTMIKYADTFELFVDWMIDFGHRMTGCTSIITNIFDDALLEKFHFVGIDEYMDVSTHKLKLLLDLPDTFIVPCLNIGYYYDKAKPIHRYDELVSLFSDSIGVYQRYADKLLLNNVQTI